MLWFYCDESYDSQSNPCKTYAVAGFLAEVADWEKIESAWIAKNERVGVPRYHAAHLNAHSHEFEGWTKQRSKRYTKDLIGILGRARKKLHGAGWWLLNDEYRSVFSEESRAKLGSPYITCFKPCIASLAHKMDEAKLPADVKFSVIFEQNNEIGDIVEVFNALKNNPRFECRERLGTCAPGHRDEFIPLQSADLIAYEAFRRTHSRRFAEKDNFSKAMTKMLPVNGFSGGVMGPKFFGAIKDDVDAAQCGKNGFFFF